MRFMPKANTIPAKYDHSFANEDVSVLGGIVAYSPDIERFTECINSVIGQVDKLVIVDNGSTNKPEYIEHLKQNVAKFSDIHFIEYSENKGIAQALSDIMQCAIDNNYDWALTLDDDSVAQPDLVNEYKKFTNMPNLGTMTCVMEDRNYSRNEERPKGKFEYVYDSITSGCFMNVNAYSSTSGYDIELFIDRVDTDICRKLTLNGYCHIRINYTGLLHEMGKGQEKKVLLHTARADNYNQTRQYYIFRNEYITRKRYPEITRIEWLQSGRPMFINFLCAATKVMLYEENKKNKISAMLNGWRDGKKYFKK